MNYLLYLTISGSEFVHDDKSISLQVSGIVKNSGYQHLVTIRIESCILAVWDINMGTPEVIPDAVAKFIYSLILYSAWARGFYRKYDSDYSLIFVIFHFFYSHLG